MRKTLAVVLTMAALACGGSGDGGTTSPPPPKVDSTKPTGLSITTQTAIAATTNQAVSVGARVVNVVGAGLPNAPVSFVATNGTVAVSSVTTDANGIATNSWTVGSVVGQQILTISVPGTALTAQIIATVTAPPPATVTGSWAGTDGTRSFKMTIVENSGVVSGTGTLVHPTLGTFAAIVNGTFLSGKLNVTFSGGFTSFAYQATLDPTNGATLSGTLTGSGFSGDALVMTKTP